ncbi:hypothetical protein Sulac_3605 (plasmid) [Sulfobacillus acidophilus DSM 10332]|uniref:Uncharacterized protein n=1 Tax=Sulfobacillus acidophilus (strain ATCC 700253 / DSM 10332 / NAL) TaxID=679936 RepID=G8U1V1_SULAD|nr:hypothetical protein Sulac_3605 [Sulfobacillus acidophilus DSM 10332]
MRTLFRNGYTRPCGQSCLINPCSPSLTCRSGRPSHSRGVLLSRAVLRYYFGLRLPAPPDGKGLAVVALPYFFNHRTRQGLTGSVQNLSKRAIPNHSTGLAGVFTHSTYILRCSAKPLRRRTSPSTEGWSRLPSHHGFTVRYGSLICLRPTRFRITSDTLPLLAIPLEWGNSQEQDFHLQASVPASRTVGGVLLDPVPSSNRTGGFPTSGSPTIVALD